nr:putative 4-hydroxy-4-methyl-2-oxoglutarate aldolase 3 [Ipomoea trifida]
MPSSDDRSTVRSERINHADVYTSSIYTRAFAHISSFIISKFEALISSDNSGEFMAFLATAEICDSNASHLGSGDLRVLHPVFQIYGQCRAFSGPIVTLKVFEDNVLVRELLESRGEGKVLVIDGAGSMRCALVGGNLAQLAQNMNWAGIIVNGCIRDVDEINGCDIGVRALATHPQKSGKKGIGEKHVPVYVGGTLIRDGEWLYADSDGVLISKSELSI